MTDKTKAPGPGLYDEALKNYEQALRTGLKLQEDIAKYWTKVLAQPGTPPDFQRHLLSLANDMVPATQKSLQECFELLEQNSRASVDLLRKGLEASQTTSPAETQKKLLEFCEGSLKSLKANTRAIVDLNSKALNSWMNWTRRFTENVVEPSHQRA